MGVRIRSRGGELRPLGEGTVPLSETERFVAECDAAVMEDRGPAATKEVVERAVRDRRLIEELPR